eukprot:CAMPEP_0170302280 /NCGR_PEP_ID=MMETSP0116_2-20130129/51420_1 /TAXON_ID=400756 /ORGANISM="Durinskia baltica, Strain CSIRO CS-38" /LENGTH=86 /DNA_ID=CAMNT_0010554143 /DNA_START=159 /DNA_END=419 /DNA_ORIENTATION=+
MTITRRRGGSAAEMITATMPGRICSRLDTASSMSSSASAIPSIGTSPLGSALEGLTEAGIEAPTSAAGAAAAAATQVAAATPSSAE